MISLFVCTTQFHITTSMMLARSIKIDKNQKLVLLVDIHRSSLKLFLNKYEEDLKKVWDEIYLINDYDFSATVNKWDNRIKDIKLLFLIRKEMKSFFSLIKADDIRDIYIATGPNGSYITEQIVHFSLKHNCIINVIEDGVSTYIYSRNNIKSTKLLKRFIKYFLNYSHFDYMLANKIYVLNKKIYVGDKSVQNKLEKIDRNEEIFIDVGKDLLEIINIKDIIYFSQNFFDVLVENEILIDLLQEHTYYYKKHPSVSSNKIENNEIDIIPWELWCKSIEDKLALITVSSTAALTPLLLYRKRNKVIFLYKLLGQEMKNEIIKFFNKVKEEYSDQVFIPENKNQLKSILERK